MITKADKKRIIANLEALLEAHREAGNMDQAVAIFARIRQLHNLLPQEDLQEDEPTWRLKRW